MNFKIIADSGCDIREEDRVKYSVDIVPLTLKMNGKEFIDDDNLTREEFMREYDVSDTFGTACPSPMDYMNVFEKNKESDGIFVFTVSKALSGSMNAALTAAKHFKEDYPDTPLHIFDTKSGSSAQAKMVTRMGELIEEGYDFPTLVEKMTPIVEEIKIYFVLDTLDSAVRSGRISKAVGKIGSALNIRLIMTENDGAIVLHEAHRNFKKALNKIAKLIAEEAEKRNVGYVYIAEFDAMDRVEYLINKVQEVSGITEFRVSPMKGVISGYAAKGGIVVGF